MRELQRGPVMLGVDGLVLSEADRERLAHPLVGGVILFARNYEHPDQLAALTASIRALRAPPPLIAVDHEGGRVQRLRVNRDRHPDLLAYFGVREAEVAFGDRELCLVAETHDGELLEGCDRIDARPPAPRR